MPFKFGIPYIVGKKLLAIVHFWRISKRKLSHMSSKGILISIVVLHFWEKYKENLNNSMNIWILNDPQNVGTHFFMWCCNVH